MWRFSQNTAYLEMALTAVGLGFSQRTPRTWQAHFNLAKKKSETRDAWKRRLKAMAWELYPELRATLSTADAILIAHYCREVSPKVVLS